MDMKRVPAEVQVLQCIEETPSIFTLKLRICGQAMREAYQFLPGQFNMLTLPGVGEVAISVASDPRDGMSIDHTIRQVGRVTAGLSKLKTGDKLGLRGPFGRGWPLELLNGKDIVVVTGGLGCAPVVSLINYVVQRREQFGRLAIVQGVKHSDDLIWAEQYQIWRQVKGTQVLLSADQAGMAWPFHTGKVTELLGQLETDPEHSYVMMCGPEGMMRASAVALINSGYAPENLFLSMERNMQCALGLCGHCQFGAAFICRDGPVFSYPEIAELLGKRGF
ncbi:FAD/NAD(P)-binding protein [Neptunomonas concharum]|uniref:Ni/Fe hydrogenase subunit gamma n=1 Tax=Neptunomonas concharum TaxID=1031538 RepID=A0A5P1R8F9_9GAMM|nr:FAD/NAD(P)-binding protein [Neptunomonas concharum]QEQ95621.1 Ni/Fe hydrogenase subunit gamma [Neptunomonas concharum]